MKNVPVTITFPLRSTFLALPLEGEAKWLFQALQESLKDYDEIFRFQNSKDPHMTLQFWREVMEIEYGQIVNQATKIAAATQPFTLKTVAVGTFGDRREDRVLFLEIAFSEELARLKKKCPWPEGKPFHPHLTIARMPNPQKFMRFKKDILKCLRDVAFAIPVDRLRLYAEVNGVKQTPLQDFPFGGTEEQRTVHS